MKHSGGVRIDKDAVSPQASCERLRKEGVHNHLAFGMRRSAALLPASGLVYSLATTSLASARMSNAGSQSSSKRPFKRAVLAFPYDSLSSRSVPHRLARIPTLHRPTPMPRVAGITSSGLAVPCPLYETLHGVHIIHARRPLAVVGQRDWRVGWTTSLRIS